MTLRHARLPLLLLLALGAPPALPARAADPAFVYVRSLGGSNGSSAAAVAVGPDGSVFVAGTTSSRDFPTTQGVVQPSWRGGSSEAFVMKLAPGGAVVWSTLLSGTDPDAAQGVEALAVGPDGSVYAAGFTEASDFPTTPGAYRDTGPGAFVAKLAPDGSSLAYSTITSEVVSTAGLAVDGAGRAWLLYDSNHVAVPLITPDALDRGFNESELVVAHLEADGSRVLYASYLGGRLSEFGAGIALGPDGSVYVAGYTSSGPTFPTTPGVLKPTSPEHQVNGFVTKLTPEGPGIVYSTLLGADVFPRALDVDGSGRAVVAATASNGLAVTPGAYDTTPDGRIDTLVMKLDASASALEFATLLGGRGDDVPVAVRVAPDGSVVVAGRTQSPDFPAGAPDSAYGGSGDGFVAGLSGDAARLLFAAFVGGSGEDSVAALGVDGVGGVAFAGTTASADFATAGAVPSVRPRAFAARLDTAGPFVDAALDASASGLAAGGRGTITFAVTNRGTAPTYGPVTVTATLPAGLTYVSAAGAGWAVATSGQTLTARHDGPIAPGGLAEIAVTVAVAPSAPAAVDIAGSVSTAGDARPGNDGVSIRAAVASVPPPVVASVVAVDRPGRPFKVKVSGDNFQPGIQVFVGGDAAPWSPVARRSARTLVLKGGAALEARFPPGVEVTVRLRNPDGGEATATLRR